MGLASGWDSSTLAAVGKSSRIAIIGAGLAGLVALDRLVAAGMNATIYEARGRIGGRVLTSTGLPESALYVEDGGHLVNTNHSDILALARRFNIGLVDRGTMEARERFVVDGVEIPEAELIADFRPLATRIATDAAAVDADFEASAPRFDAMSVAQYLDAAGASAAPRVRALVEATIRTEYGSEPGEVSALELFFNLPAIADDRVALISGSDERYSIVGGSSTIPRALAGPLMDRIRTGHALLSVRRKGKALVLAFADGQSVTADRVIITVPAQILRTIDFGDTLPPAWQALTQEFSCGRNEKINAGYAARPWEPLVGAGGAAWAARSGEPGLFSEFWGASAGQNAVPEGVLTWFFGGAQVSGLQDLGAEAILRACEREIAPAVPGLAARTLRRTAWAADPYAQGAYSRYLPGQLTRYAAHFWSEDDTGKATPPLPSGPILFAGEHLSDSHTGYMNGAAQTGRLAADQLIGARR
ncbi:MAG: flavin monoamine oxidase family protein [Blastomonas sp.]|jgi:monoamine oxidase